MKELEGVGQEYEQVERIDANKEIASPRSARKELGLAQADAVARRWRVPTSTSSAARTSSSTA